MKILLAKPRGFCAGVERAIGIVESALRKYGSPIYVRHEIVHNKAVVSRLRQKGAIFVEEMEHIPEGSVVIFSAHGVPASVVNNAQNRDLVSIDATCPLVKRVHSAVQRHDKRDTDIILIGHKGHPEVVGTMGQLKQGRVQLVGSVKDVETLQGINSDNVAYTTQTTLSFEETKNIIHAIKLRYPSVIGPKKGDMCYATTNRQKVLSALILKVDMLLVIGSANSSNSNRLREIGAATGKCSYLIDGPGDIDEEWFHGIQSVGITSGASAPEYLVQDVVQWIQEKYPGSHTEDCILLEENIHFPLPPELCSP